MFEAMSLEFGLKRKKFKAVSFRDIDATLKKSGATLNIVELFSKRVSAPI
jgi:hypothetical protein